MKLGRGGFKVGKHGRRNTNRVTVVERNTPLLGRILDAAHGESPAVGTSDGSLAAQRLAGTERGAAYLLERLPKQMKVLEEQRCYTQGRPACAQCPVRKLCSMRREEHSELPPGDRIIEVFCGAGGMSLGFEGAGFVPVLAVDLDRDAVLTYQANRPWAGDDIARCANVVALQEQGVFEALKGKVTGVIGGPPCQTFSLVGFRTKKLDDRDGRIHADSRTWLPVAMAEIIATVQPEFCVVENVGGFVSALGGKIRKATRRTIEDAGFSVGEVKVRAERHGTPQLRNRYMLIGFRNNAVKGRRRAQALVDEIVAALEEPTKPIVTLGTALENLSRFGVLQAGGGSEYLVVDGVDTWNHYARPHNERDRLIYAALAPGETATDLEARAPGSIPYDLASFHDKYRKLDPNRASPTITAHLKRDSNSFILHGVNRGLTPREAAVLQGFPNDYIFVGEQSHQFQQIGNAVPPPVAETVARLVRVALKKGKSADWKPALIGERGPAPSHNTMVVRKYVRDQTAAGEAVNVKDVLHWASRRLQTPKVAIREMVIREVRRGRRP